MFHPPFLSIIIPLSSEEQSFEGLLSDLKIFSNFLSKSITWEVLLIPGNNFVSKNELERQCKLIPNCSIHYGMDGRALQLNLGIEKSKGQHLWFLHSDSRLERKTLERLIFELRANPRDLLYFDLKFSKDGPASMGVNEFGVKIRSEWLGIPFGDQGYCVQRKILNRVGKFKKDLPYGEDHDFLWRTKIAGVRVTNTGGAIYTSARKYKTRGWSKTTLEHLYCTYKQAKPFLIKIYQERYR